LHQHGDSSPAPTCVVLFCSKRTSTIWAVLPAVAAGPIVTECRSAAKATGAIASCEPSRKAAITSSRCDPTISLVPSTINCGV
jgi:hypothetical protein